MQETATSLGGVGGSGGDAELEKEVFFRADEMPEARTQEFMDRPLRKSDFETAAHGLNDAGTGHARRAGKVISKERGQGEDEPHGGVEDYLCHNRLKGRAGASCSSVMETL